MTEVYMHIGKKSLQGQHFITMFIDQLNKMTLNREELK